jgi:hypothetical protein
MKAYAVVDTSGVLVFEVLFSTRERAERELREAHVDQGKCSIEEMDVSDDHYFRLVAAEAQEDDDVDDFFLGGES